MRHTPWTFLLLLSLLGCGPAVSAQSSPPKAFLKTESFDMQWANSEWCDIYLDDLTYTTGVEPP